MPSINMSMLANPPAAASTSTRPSLISGKKRKKGPPLHRKVPKPDHNVDVDGKNEGISDEETNDFDFEATIPEGLLPQTKSSHTERRQ